MSDFPLSDEMDRLRRAGLASDFRITDEMDRKRREGGGSDFPLTDESERRRRLGLVYDFPLTEAFDKQRRDGSVSDFPLTDAYMKMQRDGNVSEYPLQDESERQRRLGLVYDYPLTEAFDRQRRDGSVSDFPLTDAYMQQQRDGNASEYPLTDAWDQQRREGLHNDFPLTERMEQRRRAGIPEYWDWSESESEEEEDDDEEEEGEEEEEEEEEEDSPVVAATVIVDATAAPADDADATGGDGGGGGGKGEKISRKKFERAVTKLMKVVIDGVPGVIHPVRSLRNRELQKTNGHQIRAAQSVAARLDGTLTDDVTSIVTGIIPIVGLPASLGHQMWLRVRRVSLICEIFGHDAKSRVADMLSWGTIGKASKAEGLSAGLDLVWMVLAEGAMGFLPVGALLHKLSGVDKRVAKQALDGFSAGARPIPAHKWRQPVTPFAGDVFTRVSLDATKKAVQNAERRFPKSCARASEAAKMGKAKYKEGRRQAKQWYKEHDVEHRMSSALGSARDKFNSAWGGGGGSASSSTAKLSQKQLASMTEEERIRAAIAASMDRYENK